MGIQTVTDTQPNSAVFREALLADLQALEQMLESNMLECDVVRAGAEQEMFLVDAACRPAPIASEVLNVLSDPTFSPEIGKFNLEANIQPRILTGNCLRSMESDLNAVVDRARTAAQQLGADVLLSGILPSVRLADLKLENLMDRPRYHELNRSVMKMRGGQYQVLIKGIDELQLVHDSVMLEACCTSFQAHVQSNAKTFARDYNSSLLAAAPVLAVSGNSPMLLGRRLWQETRIAVFQHAVDERSQTDILRGHPTRVSFGEAWVQDSVIEIYRDQVARFRDIMTNDEATDPLAILAQGNIPDLKALALHNSTVWRWNRPCFGITEGKPHLRVEFRALPAGPTVLDEVANAALFLGLTKALPEECGNFPAEMPFEDAKENFFAAARLGPKAQITWVDGKHYPVRELMEQKLLRLAADGLRAYNIDGEDIDRYMGVVRGRLENEQTGSKWIVSAASDLPSALSPEGRDRRVTAAMIQRQKSGLPVHEWLPMTDEERPRANDLTSTLGEIMSTDLITIKPDDPISLAASLMDWRHIRHLPVERGGKLAGLISSRDILHHLATSKTHSDASPILVETLMQQQPLTVDRDTSVQQGLKLMLEHKLDCLPVTEADDLIGIVTTTDLLQVLSDLLDN